MMKWSEKSSIDVGTVSPASSDDILHPGLRSWIENVIVPILVSDYFEEHKCDLTDQQPAHSLASLPTNMRNCVRESLFLQKGRNEPKSLRGLRALFNKSPESDID
jgi:hypothetical protein